MKYSVHVGTRTLLSHTTSWVRAIRCLYDHADIIVEAGYGRVQREDGVVIMAIDLDHGVDLKRRQ